MKIPAGYNQYLTRKRQKLQEHKRDVARELNGQKVFSFWFKLWMYVLVFFER